MIKKPLVKAEWVRFSRARPRNTRSRFLLQRLRKKLFTSFIITEQNILSLYPSKKKNMKFYHKNIAISQDCRGSKRHAARQYQRDKVSYWNYVCSPRPRAIGLLLEHKTNLKRCCMGESRRHGVVLTMFNYSICYNVHTTMLRCNWNFIDTRTKLFTVFMFSLK